MTEFSDKVTVYHKAGKFDFSNRILPSGVSEVKVVKVLKTRESQYGDSTIQLLADNGAVIVSIDGSPRDKAEKLLSVIARKGFAILRFHKTKDREFLGRVYNFGVFEILNADPVKPEPAPRKGEPGYENTADAGFEMFWNFAEN